MIDLTYYCVNKKKLDFPSQMPSATDGDSSIYRAGKLYSFDGRNQWAVQGKHVNDMCTPRGTKGEPIFLEVKTPNFFPPDGLNRKFTEGKPF